jgi:PKD repeat protein
MRPASATCMARPGGQIARLTRPSRWLPALVAVLLLAVHIVSTTRPAAADPGDVGVEGPSHAGTGTPTGTKRAESVLWFNDGFWWGNLWDTKTSDFHIFRFDTGTQSWIDTGVATETRSDTHHDVLWDGTTLYVASHRFVNDGSPAVAGHPAKLYRYSYDTATDTYTPLASSQINNYRTETLVIDKDSSGRLWATWQQGKKIWMAATATDGVTWGAPFPHPATADPASPANVSIDDTSALIAFGPGRVGVMWSRQVGGDTDGFYWSFRDDTAATTAWSAPTAIATGYRSGDDHLNLKWLDSSGGRVFAAVKTSFTTASQPLIQLLAMPVDGTWTVTQIATVSECPNRVTLLIDEAAQRLRTFATYPKPSGSTNAGTCTSSGGGIYEKSTPLNAISFTTDKVLRILDVDQYVHNASSTKQNINNGGSAANSGALVIADVNATSRYWHYYDGPTTGPADTTPPTVTSVSPEDGAADIALETNASVTFAEAMDPATVTAQTLSLRSDDGSVVAAAISYDSTSSTATLDPDTDLVADTTYIATTRGGPAGVTDSAGNALAADHVWSFRTAVAAVPAPTASFTATPTTGSAPLAVEFADTASGAPTSWAWDFGDGTTSVEQNPAHTYTTAGTYQATVTATNASGSDTSDVATITVSPGEADTVVTLPVSADSYIASSAPTTNFGSSATLWVDGTPVNATYLKFDLSAYSGRTVVSATLRLRTTSNPSIGQQAVHLVPDDTWTEAGLKYSNRPAVGTVIGTLGPTSALTDYGVSLDASALQGDLGQFLSLALDSSHDDAVGLVSTQGGTPPQLILTLGP